MAYVCPYVYTYIPYIRLNNYMLKNIKSQQGFFRGELPTWSSERRQSGADTARSKSPGGS